MAGRRPLPHAADAMSSAPDPQAPPESVASREQFRALAVLVIALGVLAAFTVLRFLAPIVVAAWFAGLTAELRGRLAKRLGGRQRVAAVATAILVVVIVAPLVLLAVPMVSIAVDFGRAASRGNPEAVVQHLTRSIQGGHGGGGGGVGNGLVHRVISAGHSVADNLPALMSSTFSTVSVATMQLFLLAVCAYYFSAEGPRIVSWIERGSPLARPHFRRLTREFMSVARAMLIGELLTAVTQGTLAGITYALLRVPGALMLAVLTIVASLIPTVGSSLVWAPLTALLALAGRTREAIILGVVGVTVIATIDNVLRPFFARMGAQKVHPLLLFLGIFGGLEAFGGWGIILGPLALALFVAAFQSYARECTQEHPEGDAG